MKKIRLVMMFAAIAMAVSFVSAKSPKSEKRKKAAPTSETVVKRTVGSDEQIVLRADMMPQFSKKGGLDVFREWVLRQIKIPKSTLAKIRKIGMSLHVRIVFVVSKEGHVCDVEPLVGKGLPLDDEDLTAEIERVMYLSPKWIPAVRNGRNVSVRYVLPMTVNPW